MKKPAVVRLAQVTLACIAAVRGTEASWHLATGLRGVFILAPNMIGMVFNSLLAACAVWLAVRAQAQTMRRWMVLLFLWAVLLSPGVENLLIAVGLYPRRPQIPDDMLVYAAATEILRVVWLLAVIVWLSCSRAAGDFLYARWRPPSLLDSPFGDGERG